MPRARSDDDGANALVFTLFVLAAMLLGAATRDHEIRADNAAAIDVLAAGCAMEKPRH
jgi:hypothetical protein